MNVTLLRFSNVLGPDIVTPISRALELPAGAVDLRLRPPLPVRARGRRRPLDPVRARPTPARASTTWPATACCRGARSPTSAASAPSPLPPIGTGLATLAAARGSACRCPTSCSTCCATAGASTTGGSSEAGFRYDYTSAGAVEGVRRGAPPARHRRRSPSPRYRYERDVEQFFRHSPAVVRDERVALTAMPVVHVARSTRPRRHGHASTTPTAATP